jgi:hypothetical protein
VTPARPRTIESVQRRRLADTRPQHGRSHEEGLLNFVAARYRARFSELLKKVAAGRPPGSLAGGGRYRINHFGWWDYEYASSTKGLGPEEVAVRLRELGAGETCWVISESREIDGVELPLSVALREVWEPWEASIVSCTPGRLAYYHDNDEDEYLIFARDVGH